MSTQERINKRREYLAKKGWGYTKIGLTSLLAVPFCFLAVLFLIGAIFYLFIGLFIDHTETDMFVIVFLLSTILTLCFGLPGVFFVHSARIAHRTAKQLTYVPPVTADTLPAEEVLVRGSEEPTQEQAKVLLRGTNGSAGTGEQ